MLPHLTRSRSGSLRSLPWVQAATVSIALAFGFALSWDSACGAAPRFSSLSPAGAARGGTATVVINGSLGDAPVSAWCSRKDVQVTIADDKKTLSVTTPADASPGMCWIRLYNAEGSSGLRPFLIGLHPEVSEVEPNNRLKEAQRIEGQTVVANGALVGRQDVDTFAVKLNTGQTLVAALTANQTLGTPMDGVLQLLSPDGFVLVQNDDDQELDPRLVFTAPKDGLYCVRVFGFPANPNQSIEFYSSRDSVYRLTLTTGPFVDRAWPLAITAGSKGTVRLEGWNLGEGFNAVPIEMREGESSVGVVDPRIANAPIVQVVPHPATVEQRSENSPQAVSVPFAISGRIDADGAIDEYRFAATKGQQLAFDVKSRELGHPLDPVLQLLGPDGLTIEELDDVGSGAEDVLLTKSIPADGEYRLRVFDRFGHGGPRYVYLLTASLAEPRVSLTVGADAYTLSRDKPLEIEVQVNRANGYAEEVAIRAVDLPTGVTATTAISAKEGDSAKSVKLVLSASDNVGPAAAFRIIGAPAGKEGSTAITASATLPDFKAEVSQLWLNVPAAAKLPTK